MKTILLGLTAIFGIGLGINFFKKTPPPSIESPQKATEPTPTAAAPTIAVPQLSVEELLGRFDPANHPDFVKVGAPFSSKPNAYLRKQTLEAIQKMHAAAKKDGISLDIISATRNFNDQKNIWETKWKGSYAKHAVGKPRALAILQFSSMPGSSRHHWGTDVDFNQLNDKYFETNPVGKKIYGWLRENAHKFGFCQTYSAKGDRRPTGYEEEKWHWSYLPLAQNFTNQYREKVKYENINGFIGHETAAEIGIIEKYVLGINPDCR